MSAGPILPADLQRRLDRGRAAAALLWCGVVAWFALLHAHRIPLFGYADVATHELGHALFWQLTHSELVMLVMGNGTQVLVPLLAGLAFLIARRDRLAFGICLAWCAAALVDTAVYVYDAPRGELALLGFGPLGDEDGALGDWARILGPEHLDRLYLADRWAADLRRLAVVVWIAAVAVIVLDVALARSRGRAGAPEPSPSPPVAAPRLRTGPSAPGFSFPERPR